MNHYHVYERNLDHMNHYHVYERNLDHMNHNHIMHLRAAYSPHSPSGVGDPE